MKTYRIAAIPGDGIGTEVIGAGVEALQEVARWARWVRAPDRLVRLGRRAPPEVRPNDSRRWPGPDPPP